MQRLPSCSVENLLAAFAGGVSYDRETAEYFHPGRSARARVNGAVVAQFGQIHPEVAAARKLRQDVFLAEIDLEQLYKTGLRPVKFTPQRIRQLRKFLKKYSVAAAAKRMGLSEPGIRQRFKIERKGGRVSVIDKRAA